MKQLRILLLVTICLNFSIFSKGNTNLLDETLAPLTSIDNHADELTNFSSIKKRTDRFSRIGPKNSLINHPDHKIEKFINFDLPGHFSLSVRSDSRVDSFFYKPDLLYSTDKENVVEAVCDEAFSGRIFSIATFNIKTGEILNLTLHRSLPKKYLTAQTYNSPIVIKIKKRLVNEITSYDNDTIKFVLETANGGSYFYTKHDPQALIIYDDNKYFINMYDDSRKVYLYLVLKPRKKNLYLVSREYDFDFIRGIMSTHPIDDAELLKLKLQPKYNKLRLPSFKPFLKSVVSLIDRNPNPGKLIEYAS